MSDAELRSILSFNETDLNANRSGKLTSKQVKALDKSDNIDKWISIGLAVLFVGVAFVFTYLQVSPMLARGVSLANLTAGDKQGLTIIAVLWLVMGLFAVGSFIRSFNKVNRTVQKVEGKVSFAKVEKRIEKLDTDGHMSFVRNEVQYDLHVGTNIFSGVDEKLMNIMGDGDTYTVYYINGFGVLSAEFVKVEK